MASPGISPINYLSFDKDTSDKVSYVTITRIKGRVICWFYKKTGNYSVIVVKDGAVIAYVQIATYKTMWQMGSTKIWTNMNGVEH